MITAIAGVSPYYLGGVVSYANEAKTELLGVPPRLIEAHGAVSPEVAAAMAEGVRKRLGADLGLSTTGVAGPSGGTPEKPVGLVYLGLATSKGTQTRRLDIGSDQPRDIIQQRVVQGRPQLGAVDAAGKTVSRAVDQFSAPIADRAAHSLIVPPLPDLGRLRVVMAQPDAWPRPAGARAPSWRSRDAPPAASAASSPGRPAIRGGLLELPRAGVGSSLGQRRRA